MHAPPVIAALRKHKFGVALIALQIALTLAIICNATLIIALRIEFISRPTGLNERDLVVVQNSWVGMADVDNEATAAKLDSMTREDLSAIRKMPGVSAVTTINTMPLQEYAVTPGEVATRSETSGVDARRTRVFYYFVNQDGLSALGLKLIAGRNFTNTEIGHSALVFGHVSNTSSAILTNALAERLFPNGRAVGNVIYLNGDDAPTRIIGVVAQLMTPYGGSSGYSILLPQRLDNDEYVVRTATEHMQSVMRTVRATLYKVNRMRNIQEDSAVQSYVRMRSEAHKADRGVVTVMGLICIILISVTGGGIMGLTSFWVGQRTKQIGVRRALGATRRDILWYFQTENLLITGCGSALGIILAVGLNLLLMQQQGVPHLPIWLIVISVAFVLLLSQMAVFMPALRATLIPPVAATRG